MVTTTCETFTVRLATTKDIVYAQTICDEMEASAKARGTGIAKRTPDYLIQKMEEGKAVIALTENGYWSGFCYIETWEHGRYVANSGLIVSPAFRKSGLARQIKQKIFELSRTKYPEAKIFGLTTGLAVMKINSELGYEPVTYSELTNDEAFWKGCQSCVNHEILKSKERKNCLCTAMLYEPKEISEIVEKPTTASIPETSPAIDFKENSKLYERFMQFKKYVLMRGTKIKNAASDSDVFLFI